MKSLGMFVIIILTFVLVSVSFGIGYNHAINYHVKEWALENEYIQYHPKTGDIVYLKDESKSLLRKD